MQVTIDLWLVAGILAVSAYYIGVGIWVKKRWGATLLQSALWPLVVIAMIFWRP